MKKTTLFAFAAAAAVGFVFSACNCGGGGKNDGGEDSGGGEGPCIDAGSVCTPGTGLGCCGSGICNPDTNTCQASCKDPGVSCTTGSECCFNSCVSNQCASSCKAIGVSCGGGSECCTGNCGAGNVCADIPGRPTQADGGQICEVRGSACTDNSECCSTYCKRGVCTAAYTCGAYNDICGLGSECCSGQCSVNDGGFGYCVTVTGGGAGACAPTGNPCDQGTDCCTTVCSNLGTVPVCQPVSGCQVAGDYCTNNLQCCGGIPNGPVQCRSSTTRCDQGTSCREPGNICGKPTESDGGLARLPDGGVFQIASETNCCNGINGPVGSDLTCHVDPAGVPRCYGVTGTPACPTGYTGEPGCCIDTGAYCDFKGQCCNGGSCVVGADAGRQCVVATCLGLGTVCTGAGCCPGTDCLPTSEITSACQIPQPVGDGGTVDGGVDGGTCKPNGSSCGSSTECCSQPQGGFCNGTCQPPTTCQPQGGACSVVGDCCTGLDCVAPDGGQKTCEPGATCPSAGQACSPTNLCCNEGVSLQCLDVATGTACTGTAACTCNFIFAKGGFSQP